MIASAINIRVRRRPVSVGSDVIRTRGRTSLAQWTGLAIVLVYFIRGTVLPRILHLPESALILLTVTMLLLGCGIAANGGGKWRWSWVVVLVAFALGIFRAEQPVSAGIRWLGIVFIIIAVGPVVQNPIAIQLRFAAWKLLTNGMTTLTGIFVIWYLAHMPNLGGRVYFTSFMNQSMLLGPIAGMGIVIALVRAIWGRSWRWAVMATFGMIPVMASGSRLATLATGIAGCFLIIRRKPLLGGICVILFSIAIFSFLQIDNNDQTSDSFTGALAKKGTGNSRTDLWQCRIDEFKSSPIVGIGVAMGTGSGSSRDADGSIRVEPGSSYLAILAMTGGLGAIAFFSAMGVLIYQFTFVNNRASLDRDILSVVGIYMAVHGIAEGWILGFGSPLCFIFWLWLGNFADAASQPAPAVISQHSRPIRRFRPWVPSRVRS